MLPRNSVEDCVTFFLAYLREKLRRVSLSVRFVPVSPSFASNRESATGTRCSDCRRSRSPEPVSHVENAHGVRRRFKGRNFTAASPQPLRNIPLPHCSRVSQRQFCIIFFSKRRTVFIPSIKPSSSASFFRDSVCQRSEARVTLRKPKKSRRISSSVKPSCLAH